MPCSFFEVICQCIYFCTIGWIIELCELSKTTDGYQYQDSQSHHSQPEENDYRSEVRQPTTICEIERPKKITIPTVKSYQKLSLFPNVHDITNPSRPNLYRNIVKGPYDNVYHYLNIHFRLLREDFFGPLRQDICSYRNNHNVELQNTQLHKVVFFRKGITLNDQYCYCLEITESLTSVVLEEEKRFMTGSIVIFTNDNFKRIFSGRVARSDHLADSQQLLISFDCYPCITLKQQYLMVEYGVFFEPYYNVLRVLQSISDVDFPMGKYIINAESTIGIPKYLHGEKSDVKDPELNISQSNALNNALNQEIALIQGPPGTGKTYVGLKAVKALLRQSNKWYSNTPMLVIAVTNHALDQFLEGLLDISINILRLGGQSNNPKIRKISLGEVRKRFYQTPSGQQVRKEFSKYYKQFMLMEMKIKMLESEIDKPSKGENIYVNMSSSMFSYNMDPTGILRDCDFDEITKADSVDRFFGRFCRFIVSEYVDEDPIERSDVWELRLRDARVRIVDKNCEVIGHKVDNAIIPILTSALLEQIKEISELHNIREDSYTWKVFDTRHGERRPSRVHIRWLIFNGPLYDSFSDVLNPILDDLISKSTSVYKEYAIKQDENNLRIMQSVKLIGMTTTYASRIRKTLEQLRSPIIIVEEAAEALESHIISVLTPHCQHLIMIGDHLQLHPITADYEIDVNYKLGVSLFERMVNNGIRCHTLNVQHRMRPEISRLITPSIYPELYDHDSVKNYPSVRGIASPVYFIDHKELENDAAFASKENVHEARFLVQLAMYLLDMKYKPEQITILASYSGQVTAISQAARRIPEMQNVKITSVDNFQGEENKIILLSLVRNNKEGKIGFLKTENRICVALSRAKEGLYVMCNITDLSARSELWRKIQTTLKSTNSVGSRLPLLVYCQLHTISKLKVRTAKELRNVKCQVICGQQLDCGHRCTLTCHQGDNNHQTCCGS